MTPDAQIIEHLPLARSIAGRLRRRMPKHVDFKDVCSAGLVGLVDAAGRFDAGKGYKFSTFVGRRIAGSIQDYCRHEDLVTRTGRIKGHACLAVPIHEDMDFVDDRLLPADTLAASEEQNRHLRLAIKRLPQRERRIITAFYFEGKSRPKIAASLGISQCRISQLHAKAIERLRGLLRGLDRGAL